MEVGVAELRQFFNRMDPREDGLAQERIPATSDMYGGTRKAASRKALTWADRSLPIDAAARRQAQSQTRATKATDKSFIHIPEQVTARMLRAPILSPLQESGFHVWWCDHRVGQRTSAGRTDRKNMTPRPRLHSTSASNVAHRKMAVAARNAIVGGALQNATLCNAGTAVFAPGAKGCATVTVQPKSSTAVHYRLDRS
jgi:hypothetical protein